MTKTEISPLHNQEHLWRLTWQPIQCLSVHRGSRGWQHLRKCRALYALHHQTRSQRKKSLCRTDVPEDHTKIRSFVICSNTVHLAFGAWGAKFMSTYTHVPIIIINMLYIEKKKWKGVSCSVLSDSLWLYWLYSLPDSSVHGILQARILDW